MTELNDLLARAEVLTRWDRSDSYTSGGQTHVGFGASISIRDEAHARPTGATFASADIELDLALGAGRSCVDVTACQAQVVVEGLSASGDELRFAMHLDRHSGGEATDLHALYHWQIGGDRLDGLDIGGVLVLEAPRFPWHPVDPVLLVDFILGHFHGAKRQHLLTSPELIRYRRLLFASQSAFVAPFFREIAAALQAEPLTLTPYWPSVVPDA